MRTKIIRPIRSCNFEFIKVGEVFALFHLSASDGHSILVKVDEDDSMILSESVFNFSGLIVFIDQSSVVYRLLKADRKLWGNCDKL